MDKLIGFFKSMAKIEKAQAALGNAPSAACVPQLYVTNSLILFFIRVNRSLY